MTRLISAAELRDSFLADGFVVVRDFLAHDELKELEAQLDRYIRDVVPHLPDTAAFYEDRSRPETLKQMQHMEQDAYFAAYPQHPAWVQLAERLLGEKVQCVSPEWFNKPPGTEHPTPPHQDNYYFCLNPANVVTIWLAIDAVDEDNGCLRYVRGSHLEELRPHSQSRVLGFSQGISDYGPEDMEREVAVCLHPGDAVAHHGMTIHRAAPNRSRTRSRRSFAMVYRGLSCRRDDAAYERYLQQMRAQHNELLPSRRE